MKRFYKMVTASASMAGGFEIHLDGKPVKLPSGGILRAPNAAIADLAVREWAAQAEAIDPETMPVTQILTTAQDRVGQDRAAMEKLLLAYLDTDLLCYRADPSQPVAARQEAAWTPWLDWFQKTYGVRLKTTDGLHALRQEQAAHQAVAYAVRALDHLGFTLLQLVVGTSGSLVLGLAFMAGVATPQQVQDAATVEETYKAEIYNEAVHGLAPHEEKKRDSVLRDLRAAGEILKASS